MSGDAELPDFNHPHGWTWRDSRPVPGSIHVEPAFKPELGAVFIRIDRAGTHRGIWLPQDAMEGLIAAMRAAAQVDPDVEPCEDVCHPGYGACCAGRMRREIEAPQAAYLASGDTQSALHGFSTDPAPKPRPLDCGCPRDGRPQYTHMNCSWWTCYEHREMPHTCCSECRRIEAGLGTT